MITYLYINCPSNLFNKKTEQLSFDISNDSYILTNNVRKYDNHIVTDNFITHYDNISYDRKICIKIKHETLLSISYIIPVEYFNSNNNYIETFNINTNNTYISYITNYTSNLESQINLNTYNDVNICYLNITSVDKFKYNKLNNNCVVSYFDLLLSNFHGINVTGNLYDMQIGIDNNNLIYYYSTDQTASMQDIYYNAINYPNNSYITLYSYYRDISEYYDGLYYYMYIKDYKCKYNKIKQNSYNIKLSYYYLKDDNLNDINSIISQPYTIYTNDTIKLPASDNVLYMNFFSSGHHLGQEKYIKININNLSNYKDSTYTLCCCFYDSYSQSYNTINNIKLNNNSSTTQNLNGFIILDYPFITTYTNYTLSLYNILIYNNTAKSYINNIKLSYNYNNDNDNNNYELKLQYTNNNLYNYTAYSYYPVLKNIDTNGNIKMSDINITLYNSLPNNIIKFDTVNNQYNGNNLKYAYFVNIKLASTTDVIYKNGKVYADGMYYYKNYTKNLANLFGLISYNYEVARMYDTRYNIMANTYFDTELYLNLRNRNITDVGPISYVTISDIKYSYTDFPLKLSLKNDFDQNNNLFISRIYV